MLRKLVLGLSAAATLGVAALGIGAVTATPAEAQALSGGYGYPGSGSRHPTRRATAIPAGAAVIMPGRDTAITAGPITDRAATTGRCDIGMAGAGWCASAASAADRRL